MATFEDPKVTCQQPVVFNFFTENAYWSKRITEKSTLINDDLLPIIEQKLKYNAVNQLITKGQQIAI